MTILEKNKFSYLHFLLSILVILIHSINNNTNFELFFSDKIGLGQFAVPLFFIISGFLFFRNTNTIDDLIFKLKSRFYSLVIPYILWNFIYYIFHIIFETNTNFSLSIFIEAILNYKYNPVFWFIYQLILLTLISPFIFFTTNLKLDLPFLLLFSTVLLLDINFPFINEDAIIYYSFGAFYARLYKNNTISIINKNNIIFTLLMSLLFFYIYKLFQKNIFHNLSLQPYYTLSIVYLRISVSMFLFYIIDLLFNYKKLPKYMLNTFFLYSIHYMIVRFIIIFTNNHILNYFNNENLTKIQIVIFILTPIICIIVNYYLSFFMKKYTTKIYNILTGNRKK